MKKSRLLAAVLGSAMVLSFAGAALAEDLNQDTPIAWDDPEFLASAEECANDQVMAGPGEVVWHFIHNNTDATSGTLSATFTTEGATSTPNGEPLSANVLHYWVVTGPDTLESASDDASGGLLVLSHVCAGEEESTPTPTPTLPQDTATPSPTLPPTSTAPNSAPVAPSGANLGLVLGILLLVAGGFTAYAMRPRRGTR
jgi:hypothetical protein